MKTHRCRGQDSPPLQQRNICVYYCGRSCESISSTKCHQSFCTLLHANVVDKRINEATKKLSRREINEGTIHATRQHGSPVTHRPLNRRSGGYQTTRYQPTSWPSLLSFNQPTICFFVCVVVLFIPLLFCILLAAFRLALALARIRPNPYSVG